MNQHSLSRNLKLYCESHPNELLTNFCSVPECLRALCPDCIDGHNRFHRQANTFPDTDSIKNVKNQCAKKVQIGIQELQKLLEDVNESFEDDYIQQLHKLKEMLMTMITDHFNILEQQHLSQSFDQDRSALQQNIGIQLNQLEYLNASLEGNGALGAIKQVCGLDLRKLVEKFKKQNNFSNPMTKFVVNEKAIQQIKEGLANCLQQQQYQPVVQQAQHQFAVSQQLPKSDYQIPQLQFQSQIVPQSLYSSSINQSQYLSKNGYFRCQNKCLHFFQQDSYSLWLYDLMQQSWREVKVNIKVPFFSKSIMTPDGSIYLIGGSVHTLDNTNKKSGSVYLLNQQSYDLVEIVQLNTPRSSQGITYHNNEIYVVGGYTDQQRTLSSCEAIHIDTWKRRNVPSLQAPIASAALCSFNDKVIRVGGLDANVKIANTIELLLNDQWVYLKIQDIPSLTAMLCAIQIEQNQIIIFGGYTELNKGSDLSVIIDITNLKVLRQDKLPFPEGFWNNTPVIYNNRVYALQNVIENFGNDCSQSERKIVTFDGQVWQ